jgi:hypothetical protein
VCSSLASVAAGLFLVAACNVFPRDTKACFGCMDAVLCFSGGSRVCATLHIIVLNDLIYMNKVQLEHRTFTLLCFVYCHMPQNDRRTAKKSTQGIKIKMAAHSRNV